MKQFPSNFYWGSATSSYQVEGANSNADWWPWEISAGKEQSGDACRHYQLYEQDFDLIKSLGHNAHRLSIEWSRVEPEEGRFDEKEIQHYVDVVKALRARGIEPMVTLHHFTNPIWLSKQGAWEKAEAAKKFDRYSERMVKALAEHVHFWMTINEPNIYSSHSYFLGVWPPQKKDFLTAVKIEQNMIKGHLLVYKTINRIYKEKGLKKPAVSIAQHMAAFMTPVPNVRNRLAVWLRHKLFNCHFIDVALRHKALDYIGLNYYSRQIVKLRRWSLYGLLGSIAKADDNPKRNFLGWDIYPEGLYDILIKIKKYNLPILITENGICTNEDSERWDFIQSHLAVIHRAMEKGVKMMGYLYWSLMDNFEWAHGYSPRFGLIHVDYETQKRTPRDSAVKFGEICRTGVLK